MPYRYHNRAYFNCFGGLEFIFYLLHQGNDLSVFDVVCQLFSCEFSVPSTLIAIEFECYMIVVDIGNIVCHDSNVLVKTFDFAFAAFRKCQPHRISVPRCKVMLSFNLEKGWVYQSQHDSGNRSFIRYPRMPQPHVSNDETAL